MSSRPKGSRKGGGGKPRPEKYEGTRTEMDRAVRSLGILEHLFLMIAALTSLLAGALVAWLLLQAFGLSFRPTWAVSSLVLFVVPGTLSYLRVRRAERTTAKGQQRESETS